MLRTTEKHGLTIARQLRYLANLARQKRNADFLSCGRYIVRGMLRTVEVAEYGLKLTLKCGSVVKWKLDSIVANAAASMFSILTNMLKFRCRSRQEAFELMEIRAHDCVRSNCGPVCTFGDW